MTGASLRLRRAGSTTEIAAIHRKPDAAERICHYRLMTLYALYAPQAVRESKFARVSFGQTPPHQLVAVHTEDVIGGCNPQRSIAVFCDAKNLLVQGFGSSDDGLEAAETPESETFGGSHPQDARGIFKKAIHVFGWQAVARRIGDPAVFRQRA